MGIVRDASAPGEEVRSLAGGQGGIRTRGGCYTTHAFQACALNHSATCPEGVVGPSYSVVTGGGNGIFPAAGGLANLLRHWGSMVLLRAFGWMLLAMAVAAIVNDCLAWWSQGAFRLLSLGELWSRLDYGSLLQVRAFLETHLAGWPWRWLAVPGLRLPALPVFTMAGVILICSAAGTVGPRPEASFVTGSRPPRRRRGRGSIS